MDELQELSSYVKSLRRRVAELEAKLELAPADLESYLRTIFDDMFEGVQVLDFDLRYVYINNAALIHSRQAKEDLLGSRMIDRYPGVDQTEIYHLMKSCLSDRSPRQMINHFVYPDGGSAWFDLRISPIPMGIVVFSVDISERKKAEEELRQSREDLEITLQCMTEGVITTDLDGRIVRMNAAAEALTGWPEAEARGRRISETVTFLNQESKTPVDDMVGKILREERRLGLANHTILVTRDGSHIPIASSGAPIRDAGGLVRGVVLVLKNMKEEHELTAMFQRAQKMEALGRLAGGVAHDFNNLLTVVSGYSNMLLQDLPPEDPACEPIREISKAGNRAAALTRQLLAFSRQQVLETRILDINEIVRDAHAMLHPIIGEDISLVTNLDPHLSKVRADAGQIEQVILNLAVNARDAMPSGGRLTIETAEIDLDVSDVRNYIEVRAGRYVMLAVSDTGCGMDAEVKARIFDPFFTTKGPGKGTGLGLATVFGIVKQSGGHISVYSERGYGTSFKIYLPASAEDATVRRPLPAQPAPPGTETVLLVEDEDVVRDVTASTLRRLGYTVLSAAGGREAIRICENHQGPIHLLISDIVMPEMDGRKVAEAVATRRPGIKVLYISGYTDGAVSHGIIDQEVAFLQKPFTPDLLARKIREALAMD